MSVSRFRKNFLPCHIVYFHSDRGLFQQAKKYASEARLRIETIKAKSKSGPKDQEIRNIDRLIQAFMSIFTTTNKQPQVSRENAVRQYCLISVL